MLFDKCFLFKYLLHTHIYTHTTILIHFFNSSNFSHIYTHIHKHFNVLNITHTHTHRYLKRLHYGHKSYSFMNDRNSLFCLLY